VQEEFCGVSRPLQTSLKCVSWSDSLSNFRLVFQIIYSLTPSGAACGAQFYASVLAEVRKGPRQQLSTACLLLNTCTAKAPPAV
jgi:hypothetical protein